MPCYIGIALEDSAFDGRIPGINLRVFGAETLRKWGCDKPWQASRGIHVRVHALDGVRTLMDSKSGEDVGKVTLEGIGALAGVFVRRTDLTRGRKKPEPKPGL